MMCGTEATGSLCCHFRTYRREKRFYGCLGPEGSQTERIGSGLRVADRSPYNLPRSTAIKGYPELHPATTSAQESYAPGWQTSN